MKIETMNKLLKGVLIAAGTGAGLLLSSCLSFKEDTEDDEVLETIDGTCEVVEDTGGEEG